MRAVQRSAAGGNCSATCPLNYAFSPPSACNPCPFGETSDGGAPCAPGCDGLCLDSAGTLDPRRLALPCASGKGSRVFLLKSAGAYPFALNLESSFSAIIQLISVSVNPSSGVKLSWGASFSHSFALTSLTSPLNSTQASNLLASLILCTAIPGPPSPQPLTLTFTLTVKLSSSSSDTRTSSPTTLQLRLYSPSVPAWGAGAALANLTVSPSANLTAPPLAPAAAWATVVPGVALRPWAPTTALPPGSLAWSSDSPAAISRAVLQVASGCLPGDALTLPADAVAIFFGKHQLLPLPQPACGFELLGTGSLTDYLATLALVTFNSTTTDRNIASSTLLRTLSLQLEGLATLYTTLKVLPNNNAPPRAPASSTLLLTEGFLPDFALAVMPQGCSGTVLGLPTLCFSDPDAPLFRAEAAVDAYAGAALGALALQPAANYTALFSAFAVSPTAPCLARWSAVPIGAAVYDCSTARVSPLAPSQPAACWWQRYRVVLALPSRPACALPNATCAQGCCRAFLISCQGASSVLQGAAFTAQLQLTDMPLVSGISSPITRNTSVSLVLQVASTPLEAPALVWPDGPSLASLGLPSSAALPPGSPLLIDDTTGLPSTGMQLPRLLLCSQLKSTIVAFAPQPLEGPGALTLRAPLQVGSLFSAVNTSATVLRNLSSLPACAAAMAPADADFLSTWVYATPLTIIASRPQALRALPARALDLLLLPSRTIAEVPPLTLPVTLTRANSNVAWLPPATLSLREHTAPGAGAPTAVLTVADRDAEQDVRFTILGASLLSCNGNLRALPYAVPPGLFALYPTANSSDVTDAATGMASVVPTTRSLSIGVGLDALDLPSAAASCVVAFTSVTTCVFNLTLMAQDSGNFTPSHSLLPPQPPTSATTSVSLTVFRDNGSNSAPTVTQILGVPPAGLSAAGGDVLELVGSGLGLPAGAASNVSATFFNGASAFPLSNCSVVQRLQVLRCVTQPGFGAVSALTVRVGALSVTFSSATAPALTLPSYQRPRVLAVLTQPQPGLPRAAAWHAVLPPVGAPAFSGSLSALLAGASAPPAGFQPPPSNLTLLVEGAPAALGQFRGTVWAAVQLDFGALLPLGVCTLSSSASSAGAIDYSALGPGSPAFAAALTQPVALASAAWYDCPFPALSAGHFRQLVVHVEYSPSAAATAPGFSGELYLGGADPQSIAFSLSLPRQLRLASAAQDSRALPSRAAPSISALQQGLPGGSFIIVGTNLGAPGLAWHSDRVEYALVNESGAAAAPCSTPEGIASKNASCAVHVGVACRYLAPNTSLGCEMQAGGWGGGFAVRVLVGGQASAWHRASTLAYAEPVLDALSVAAVSGLEGAASSSARVPILEPAGGGLLLLQGYNLWPPQALVVTVGGVRVFPIGARPLQPRAPAASRCTLSLACAAATAMQNASQCPSLGCFGAAAFFWAAETPTLASAPRALQTVLVTYPPGLGNVSVAVSLGGGAVSTLQASYGEPQLLKVLASEPAVSGLTYDFYFQAARLSPCVHCVNSTGSICLPVLGAANTSSLQSARSRQPLAGAGEGALPQPFNSSSGAATLNSCALPDSLWTWSSADPATRSRSIKLLPSATLQQGSASNMQPFIGSVTLKPALGQDVLEVKNASLSLLTLLYRAVGVTAVGGSFVPPLSESSDYNITSEDLSSPSPRVTFLSPALEWSTTANASTKPAQATAINTGPYGSILVYPIAPPALSGAAALNATWPHGPIACPITPRTILQLVDLDGNTNEYEAGSGYEKLFKLAPPPLGLANAYLHVWGSDPFWTNSSAPLPCSVTIWRGTSTVSSIPSPPSPTSFVPPAWQGSVQVEVYSKGLLSSSGAPSAATYSAPTIAAISPATGPTAGGAPVTLTGRHFGVASSLGGLWSASGAGALAASIAASLAPGSPWLSAGQGWPSAGQVPLTAFPHRVHFAYQGSGNDNAVWRRYCTPSASAAGTASAWTDTAITCLAPEGIAGSVNIPVLTFDLALATAGAASAAFETSVRPPAGAPALFTYPPPGVRAAVWVGEQGADPQGTAPQRITLTGANLSRFTQLPGAVDPSENGRWNYSLSLVGEGVGAVLQGMVLGSQDATVLPQSSASQTFYNDAVTFDAPALLEGNISITLVLTFSGGSGGGVAKVVAAPVTLQARAPVITSVAAVAAAAAGPSDDDYDPCANLAAIDAITERVRRAGGGAGAGAAANASSACLAGIRSYFAPAPPQPASCFRTTPSPLTGGTVLRITGRYLGSGAWPLQGVLLYSLAVPSAAALASLLPAPGSAYGQQWRPSGGGAASTAAVACELLAARTQWGNASPAESTLYCALNVFGGTLPRGPARLLLGAAYTTTAAAAPLIGGCACGTFSEADGAGCAPCDSGAFCLGGLEPPRATAGVWETRTEQWRSERSIYAVPPRWVPCATPAECLPNNTCAAGAVPGSFMCTQCRTTGAVVYKRGADGVCAACDPGLSRALVLGLGLGLPVLLACALAARWCCARLQCCASARAGGSAAVAAAAAPARALAAALCACRRGGAQGEGGGKVLTGAGEAAPGAAGKAGAAAPPPAPQPIPALLKIAITFFQTLGALSLYTSRVRGRVQSPDALLLPSVVNSLRFFLDFGLSMSEFRCALELPYTLKLTLFVALPVLCLLLVPPVLWVALRALNAARGALHAAACAALGLPPKATQPVARIDTSPLQAAVGLMFFLLPTVVSTLSLSRDCAPELAGGYLYNDPAVPCQAPDVVALTMRATQAALFYIFGLPTLIFAWCVLSLPGFELFDGLLAGNHRTSYFAMYWECVTLMRKAIILGLATSLLPLADPRSQVIATALFLAFSLAFHLAIWPYGSGRAYNAALNWLDALSILGCMAVALSIMSRLQSMLGTDNPLPVLEQNILDFGALLLCGPFLLLWALLLVDALVGGGTLAPAALSAGATALSALQYYCTCTCLRKVKAADAAAARLAQESKLKASRKKLKAKRPGGADGGQGASFTDNPMAASSWAARAASSRRLLLSGSSSTSASAGSLHGSSSLLSKMGSSHRLAGLQGGASQQGSGSAGQAAATLPAFDCLSGPPALIRVTLAGTTAPAAPTEYALPRAAAAAGGADADRLGFAPDAPRGWDASPPVRSASDIARGLWRLQRCPGAADAWVQDGTGDAVAHHPPLGAQLPGGWTVVRSTTHAGGFVYFHQGRYERSENAIAITELPEMLLQTQQPEPLQQDAPVTFEEEPQDAAPPPEAAVSSAAATAAAAPAPDLPGAVETAAPPEPDVEAPPPKRSASAIARGLWRLRRSPGETDAWLQDGTGDSESYYPPLGAQLPGGWTVVRSTTHAGGVVYFHQGRYERGEHAIAITELPEMLLEAGPLAPPPAAVEAEAPPERYASLRLAQPAPAAAAPAALPGAAHAIAVEDEEAAAWGEGASGRGAFSIANPMARASSAPAAAAALRGGSGSSSSSGDSFTVHNPLRPRARAGAEDAQQQQQASKAPQEGCTPV